MLKVVNIFNDNISVQAFGGKAYGLALLHQHGFAVPMTLAIEATNDMSDIDDTTFYHILKTKLSVFENEGIYDIAVRSSCTTEDSFSDSMAGHFDTFIGKMTFDVVIENIKSVINGLANGNDTTARMGVVIQRKINADYSGVLFSSDPILYSKKRIVISYTKGIGDKLVSGEVTGTDVFVHINDDDFEITGIYDEQLIEAVKFLSYKSKELEKKLNYPVDIEWAIVEGNIYFLQCRPLASITRIKSCLQLINNQNISSLPASLVSHDKVKLRLMAHKIGVLVSDAYLYIQNSCSNMSVPIILEQSQYYKGYSAVIIHPQRLSNKVVRSFVGDKKRVFDSITNCCRYGIRSYPDYESLNDCLNGYLNLLADEYWISVTIIQEIFDPLYTGVIQKISEGYLIEITRGHFLTKGVVPTSQYSVSFDGDVILKNEVLQHEWLKIVEGHIISCECDKDEDAFVSLKNEELKLIVRCFEKILENETSVVEFGILKILSDEIKPYLIDFVDDNSLKEISISDIKSGIISRGRVSGRIVYTDNSNEDSLNVHFYNTTGNIDKREEKLIFFCEKPEISLLKILARYNPSNIGFVFNEGAILCHFAVVLREKGIPAIKIKDVSGFNDGDICVIDAETSNLTNKERLRYE